jgi:EGF-like domain
MKNLHLDKYLDRMFYFCIFMNVVRIYGLFYLLALHASCRASRQAIDCIIGGIEQCAATEPASIAIHLWLNTTLPVFQQFCAFPCLAAPCQNGGTCTEVLSTYTCACAPGFAGPNCQYSTYSSFMIIACYIFLLLSVLFSHKY